VSCARRGLLAALLLALLGSVWAWLAPGKGAAFPVVVAILVTAIAVAGRTRSGRAAWVVALLTLVALVRVVGSFGPAAREGDDGLGAVVARGPLLVGLLAAVICAIWIGLHESSRAESHAADPPVGARDSRPRQPSRLVPVGALMVLSAIGAELLAAYDDSTGRPGELLFALVFFAMLYGCPALLIREVVRRLGRGWPSILALSAAAGLLQAGMIDQALYADSYGDIAGWEESLRSTYIAPLGIGGFMLQNFLLGHVVFSFGAPIAIAESLRPEAARMTWLSWRGTALAVVLWLLAAAAIVSDTYRSPAHATVPELAVTLLVVLRSWRLRSVWAPGPVASGTALRPFRQCWRARSSPASPMGSRPSHGPAWSWQLLSRSQARPSSCVPPAAAAGPALTRQRWASGCC
jgi:hypothetical protein